MNVKKAVSGGGPDARLHSVSTRRFTPVLGRTWRLQEFCEATAPSTSSHCDLIVCVACPGIQNVTAGAETLHN